MASRTSTTRRQVLVDALLGAGAMGLLANSGAAAASGAMAASDADAGSRTTGASAAKAAPGIVIPTGGVHDFDFFAGHWTGANRRLKQRWVGSNDWDTFTGTLRCETRLGSMVNIDEVDFPTKGWSGMTVRVFSLEKRQWSLYWIDSKTGGLFPPVVGGFNGDSGEFFGDDTDEGRPVKLRFRWRRLGPDAAHWEQAFSLDGGREWETNWTVEHRRVKS